MKSQSRKLLNLEADVTLTSPTTHFPPPPPLNGSAPRPPPFSLLGRPMKGIRMKPMSTPFDSSMALTVLVLLAALFFMGFFSVYIRRFADENSVDLSRRRLRRRRHRSSSSSDASSSPPPLLHPPVSGGKGETGVDPSTIESLPVFSYAGTAVDCPVCLGEFEPDDLVKAIPYCRHVFHPGCIDTWLGLHVSCPLCRTTRLFPAKGCGGEDLEVVVMAEECSSSSVGGEGGGISTAESEDTWTEEGRPAVTLGMRRSRSCSSMGERVPSLQRTKSF